MEVRDRQLHGRLLAGDRPERLPLHGRRQRRAAQVPGQRHLHRPGSGRSRLAPRSPRPRSSGPTARSTSVDEWPLGGPTVRWQGPVELSGRDRGSDPRAGERRHGLLRREVGAVRAIYAVARDGTLRWQYGPVPATSPYGGFPTVGADGIVYVGSAPASTRSRRMACRLDLRHRQRRVLVPGHRGNGEQANRWPRRDLRRLHDWKLHAISSPRHGTDSNDPPTASAGPDQTALVGHVVQFNASASDQNPDVLSFAWDFGDGKSAFGLTASPRICRGRGPTPRP